MASDELSDLLRTYEFLDKAIERHAGAMTSADARRLKRERAEVLGKLLSFPTSVPTIALTQIKTLMKALPAAAHDPELLAFIGDTTCDHLDRLSAADRPARDDIVPFPDMHPTQMLWPGIDRLNAFDASTDRIVILDRNYRYQFSNRANATFHGVGRDEFIGKPLWKVTSEHFFERVTKPLYDRCFSGHPSSCVAPQPGRDPNELYSAHLNPIVDQKGQVVAALAVVRRVEFWGG